VGVQGAQRGWGLFDMSEGDGQIRLAAEWHASGRHLVQHDTQSVDV
jgi:hypothetical protein